MKWTKQPRSLWWYIAKTDEFPYSYWNGEQWGSSFREYAAKFDTKPEAEQAALVIVAQDPALVGVVKVILRD